MKRAKKALRNMDHDTRRRIIERFEDLKNDPYAENQLVSNKMRRSRVGDYRILFHICTPARTIIVPCITKRGRAYGR